MFAYLGACDSRKIKEGGRWQPKVPFARLHLECTYRASDTKVPFPLFSFESPKFIVDFVFITARRLPRPPAHFPRPLLH